MTYSNEYIEMINSNKHMLSTAKGRYEAERAKFAKAASHMSSSSAILDSKYSIECYNIAHLLEPETYKMPYPHTERVEEYQLKEVLIQ